MRSVSEESNQWSQTDGMWCMERAREDVYANRYDKHELDWPTFKYKAFRKIKEVLN